MAHANKTKHYYYNNYSGYVRKGTKQQKLFCSKPGGQQSTKLDANSLNNWDDKQEGMHLLIEKSRLIEGRIVLI